jgi:iron complex outermembrane receptor protein
MRWETGYSRLAGRGTLLEAALFLSQISNSTERFYVQPNVYQLRNVGEARYRGEFGVRSNVTPSLLFTANYTYLSRKNTTNPGLLLVGTPRHKLYSSATYRFGGRVRLMADLLYESSRFYQNDAGTFGRAGAFASVNLGGSIPLTRNFEIEAGMVNLLDRSYFLVEGYPEAGRSAFVNLRFRF